MSVKLLAIALSLSTATALLVSTRPALLLHRRVLASPLMIASTPTPLSDGSVAPTCVEDEAVEECVILSWQSGKFTVSRTVADTAQLGFLLFLWFSVRCSLHPTD